MSCHYAIAVDIGGTFTDITLADRRSGRLWQVKTPTTPADQSEAFVNGVRRVLTEAGVAAAEIEGVFHGTTVATNAILERKGATLGLLTTEGCRYVLHIGRHDVARNANSYFWIRPARLVPPRRIHEVSERMGPDGSVERALDEDGCRRALRVLKQQGIESLAICLLHAYANPVHEHRVRELAEEELPGIPCSLSSEVLPVFREYERTTATVLNAYVVPQVAGYHQRLETRLQQLGISAPLRIMKSNGGMYGAHAAATQPLHTALSGPAAAAVGSILVGQAANLPSVISIDVGGTSADICLSQHGKPAITSAGEISGLPLNVPMVDVHSIGAGGGSIARVTDNNSLRVGPESAGAEPGPACYGRGGKEATVTDANLVLGRSPASLGGEMPLDIGLAEQAIMDRVAKPLGLSLHEAAEGVVELVNNNMAAAIRSVSVERGYDPRKFALVAGGGAGPLHAGRLAVLLNIPLVIVPSSAGLLSTLGLLATDLKSDFVQTVIRRSGCYDLPKLNTTLAELERKANAWFRSEGVAASDAMFVRTASLRYINQAYEITVTLPEMGAGSVRRSSPLTEADLASLQQSFHQEHEQLYAWSSSTLPVELVNLGVSAYGRLAKLNLSAHTGSSSAALASRSTRMVYFGRSEGMMKTPIYAFATLVPGQTITGPAVIEQRFATVLVLPGHTASMDRYGNILMKVQP
ncbi:MAG: hydantoinase/oxoprolinase family protein [Betaproteobacteria bacterium]|nr:hydantoinase/oxoprolinase family protein [Betaproteobacteria bacterium]